MKPEMPDLFAWVGEDEFDRSPGIGLKQAIVAAGTIPMVATTLEKMDQPRIVNQMRTMSKTWGKEIYLVRFVAVEIIKKAL